MTLLPTFSGLYIFLKLQKVQEKHFLVFITFLRVLKELALSHASFVSNDTHKKG